MQRQAPVSDRRPRQSLTTREIETLDLAGTGISMKAMAQVLGISAGTVNWHLKNSYQKLGVGCRDEALRKARALKLIQHGAVCPACAKRLSAAPVDQH